MAKPTESEIRTEMTRIGGTGGDYFSAQTRLQHRLDEAERALEKLKPIVSETDAAPWSMEPTSDQILAEAKNFGLTNETAREKLREKLAADAKRLASFSAEAATEISEALAEVEAARSRAANVLAAHESALESVTLGIHSLGKIRQKISVVKSLLISEDGKRQIANAALDYWVNMKTGFDSVAMTSGFREMSEDLAFRTVLNDHIPAFVAPLEKQAATIIASVRAQADDSKMDLKKVFALLASERGQRAGESLLQNSEFYEGLI
jgi:hypothetical protein